PLSPASRASPVSLSVMRRPPRPPLFPYTTLFRSQPVQPVSAPLPLFGGLTAAVVVGRRAPQIQPRPVHHEISQLAQDSTARIERSEEHTSELQSRGHLVCRLLLEKKNNTRERRST